jgi:chromosome segregation ATPase
MSWFESLSKEMFQALVRDAVKDELAEIKLDVVTVKNDLALVKTSLAAVQNEMEGVKQRLTKLEERVERLQENQLLFANKVGHLEGTVEGTLRGLMTEFKYDLYERLRNELPSLVANAQAGKPAKKKALANSSRG